MFLLIGCSKLRWLLHFICNLTLVCFTSCIDGKSSASLSWILKVSVTICGDDSDTESLDAWIGCGGDFCFSFLGVINCDNFSCSIVILFACGNVCNGSFTSYNEGKIFNTLSLVLNEASYIDGSISKALSRASSEPQIYSTRFEIFSLSSSDSDSVKKLTGDIFFLALAVFFL